MDSLCDDSVRDATKEVTWIRSMCNFITLHFLYGLSQLMPYPVMCARTFQSARCELLVPIQQSPGG